MSSLVQVIKEIRDEYEAALGERPTKAQAAIIWEREKSAFEAMIEHVGMKPAAERCPRCADYFKNWWVGKGYPQGAELRQALKEIAAGRTTQVELAEAQLAAMEQAAVVEVVETVAAAERPVVDPTAPSDDEITTQQEQERDAQLADEVVELHDFCVEVRRSSSRLNCQCGKVSRFSRDEDKVRGWVDEHRAEVVEFAAEVDALA